MSRPDVVVVGAGVFGLSAALELRRRGRDVTVLDPGPVPHPRASSTDISKIVRMDYGADDFMTGFAELAMAGWDAWNGTGEPPLFHRDGLLVLAGGPMARGGFEHESFRRLTARGVPLERLDPLTLAHRFPAWNADLFPDGYFNPDAGWAESGAVVDRLARRAARAGVRLRLGATVRSLLEGSGRVRGIVLDGGTEVRAGVTLVAAGAWSPALVPGLDRLARAVGQPVLHFGVEDPEPWRPRVFPVWAADIARTGWYGFPVTPDGRVKVGHHGRGIRQDDRLAAPRPGGGEAGSAVPEDHVARCRAFLRRALPALADAPVVGRRLCLYCDTVDGNFVIDRHPDLEGLVVATGGSGHGFKFAPVLGPVVADAVEGAENRWGRPFRWREPVEVEGRLEAARYGGEPGTG